MRTVLAPTGLRAMTGNCIEPITRITSFSIPGALKAHHCSETLPGYCCLPAVSGREVERNH